MRIVLHQSWEELQPLAADWNRLLAESCSDTIFLTWEWCRAWWNAYGRGHSLCVLTAWNNDELVGVAPFYADASRHWYGKWTCLRIVGAGSGDSDYLDCFTRPGLERQVLALVFEFLESFENRWDWLQVEGAPQESSCLAAIGEIAAERGWSFVSEDIPCATLSLPREWEDYLRQLRPRVRTKIRSALAYFEEIEAQPTQCSTLPELDSWLAQLFEIHTRRWQKRQGPGVFRSEARQSFYREVSRATLQKGWLAFHRLTWCDRPLALQYGFRYHNHIYALQEGYDPSFERLRPGVALRGWVMRDEIQQGLTEYDFLAGTARHKLDWGAQPKVSRLIRLAKKPAAIWMSMSMPAISRSLRDNASNLVPQSVRSIRARVIHSRQQKQSDSTGAPMPLTKQVIRWSASHLYADTPLGVLSREVANRRAWHLSQSGDSAHCVPACTILRYHRVNDNQDPFFKALPVPQFEAQMRYLARNFQFVSLNQLTCEQAAPKGDRYCVAVTFDDGYRDNFVHAFPILKKLAIPVTIFLTTGYIESGQLPWYDHVRLGFKLTSRSRLCLQEMGGPTALLETESHRLDAMQLTINWLRTIDDETRRMSLPALFRNLGIACEMNLPGTMLNWTEIRQMQRMGVEFGAHTVTHPVLRTLSGSRLFEEVVGCKTTLENRLQVNVRHFAYPFGKPEDLSDIAKQAVRAAGFRTAVTTIPGFNLPAQDLFELKRLNLEESDPAIFGLKFDWSRMSSPTGINFTEAASV